MSISVPSLNWLRVFEAAARFQSFARAAEELNMSAAAVSQQVRALEDRVGAPLFTRAAHSVALTDVGRAYLPIVQQSLLSLQNATEGLFGEARAQQLHVQAELLFSHGVLARGYRAFTDAHPQISLLLSSTLHTVEMGQGYFDMRIVFGSPLLHEGDSDFLLAERLYPVARADVAAAIEAPQDLLGHTLIEVTTHRAGWAYVLEEMGQGAADVRFAYADSTLLAMAMASEGVGVALSRAPMSDSAMAGAGLVPCLPGFETAGREGYHLVYPERAALRRPARVFREWLIGFCARVAARDG
ncbi:MAG: LysR family transcriptional regulator [Pseudomonadota bacterium]